MAVATGAVGFFLPIFAFLLVFIVVYAMLFKSKALGENQFVMLFVSFILASFFIVQANLVEFVRFTSAWASVIAIAVFLVVIMMALIPGKVDDDTMKKIKPGIVVLIVVLMIIMFIVSAGYVFDLAVNFDSVGNFFSKDWVGGILLVAIALIVSWRIKKDSGDKK